MIKFYRKVVDEDFALCEKVQRNLERGVFVMGPLHPFHEEGAQAFQSMVLKVLREQVEKEREAGREIWAARPAAQGIGKSELLGDVVTNGDSDGRSLCEQMLGCDKTKLRGLEW